eukprot:1060083-Amphidinium_carterae.1
MVAMRKIAQTVATHLTGRLFVRGSCVLTMSSSGQRSLGHEEASLLLQCGSFWPDSMVDKSSFMKMLLHVLNVEAEMDNHTARWEEILTASAACNVSRVVD